MPRFECVDFFLNVLISLFLLLICLLNLATVHCIIGVVFLKLVDLGVVDGLCWLVRQCNFLLLVENQCCVFFDLNVEKSKFESGKNPKIDFKDSKFLIWEPPNQ